ncbi:ABC transporter transmembrane domain-containing protein [Spirochaetota bacterium]
MKHKNKNKPAETGVNHILWIKQIYGERRWLIILLLFLTLLSSAVAVIYPYLSMKLIDSIQRLLQNPGTENPMTEIHSLLMVFVAVGLAELVSAFFPSLRGMTNNIFEHIIRMKYFGKIMQKDHDFFASFSSGDIVTRLTDDLNGFPKLAWFLCSGIFRAVEALSKVLFCLTAMFLIHPVLTLYSLIPLPIMIAIFYITQDRIYDTFQKNQEAISDTNSRLEMSFSGARIIKAYASEEKYRRFFRETLEIRKTTELASARLEIILHLIYMNIDYVAQAGIVFAGGIMAVMGKISIGTFYAFYTYLLMLIYPILNIPQLFVSGKRAFVNIDRLEELAAFPHKAKAEQPVEIGEIGNISCKNVSFKYKSRDKNALSSVSFTVNKGEKLGIIGPVGSGKTCILKLLLGLLSPDEGSVLVNGHDIKLVDMAGYRGKLAYVPQEPLLFSGTLRENVDFGSAETSDELFMQAVEAAQISDEIAEFSLGQNTVIGQRGVSLSGGQKQRMAIARAVAKKATLYIFDDITASLDAANEDRLMGSLQEMSKDLSFIIVSHRLSTLQYVDKVAFMDNGRLVGIGSHEELLANPHYRDYLKDSLKN